MREEFKAELTSYLGGIGPNLSHDARRSRFMDFARETLGIPVPEYKIEEPLVLQPGFIDALLGNLVFEFKKDIPREIEDAEGKLRKYLTDLRATMPQATFTAVATDGVRFRVYLPVFEGLELKELGTPLFDVQLRADTAKEAYDFLESLFFVYRTIRRIPTAADIVAHLGPHSPTFARFQRELSRLFQGCCQEPAVEVRFQEWRKYLVRVYGEDVGDEALFLKHTYLSAIARFTAFLFLFPGAALASPEIDGVVRGSHFSGRGFVNFGEDDFFTWVLQPPAGELGRGLMRRLGGSLEVYDFTTAKQDLLKELYEQLLGQEARHNLGEYYTPDWLAEYILTEMVKLPDNPNWRVLDPACGSGTFLFIALRLLRATLESLGVPREDVLRRLLSQVVGMDVHPVAVTIARTNYLLALGDLVKPHPPFSVSIPVYLSDSLRLVEVARKEKTGHPEDTYEVKAEGGVLEVSGSLADNPSLLDETVEAMRGLLPYSRESALKGFEARLSGLGLTTFARDTLLKDMEFLLKLYSEGKDTVWLYFLKNLPRPRFLERQPFDVVVGNPPWISLRYIGDPSYARFLRREWLKTYGLLLGRQAHLFFHIDTSALFFAKAADLYLKREGLIAFVMPRGVFTASQYAIFTGFDFLGDRSVVLGLQEVVDMAPEAHQRVEPLFLQAACVLVARKGSATNYPVPATRLWGGLPGRNLAWKEAEKHLSRERFKLERTPTGKLVPLKRGRKPSLRPGRSPYYDKVFEGATIVPRSLFFVRAEPSPPTLPLLVTDPQVAEKPPWKGTRLRGQVEPRFLYGTAT